MKIIAVIPARYESVRFPGKVLARQTGKYLIEHTWEQVRKVSSLERIIIATDSEKVLAACRNFGAECVMTLASHQSGTDRIAEAVEKIDTDIVINVQGDEPEIEPANIELLAGLMRNNPKAKMATLIAKFVRRDEVENPNIVKGVTDKCNNAVYFSRSVIPYCRKTPPVGDVNAYFRHLGIYAYTKDFLLQITKLPPGRFEQIEQLEQLRVIENGIPILTGLVEHISPGIDTPQQYDDFVKRIKGQKVQ